MIKDHKLAVNSVTFHPNSHTNQAQSVNTTEEAAKAAFGGTLANPSGFGFDCRPTRHKNVQNGQQLMIKDHQLVSILDIPALNPNPIELSSRECREGGQRPPSAAVVEVGDVKFDCRPARTGSCRDVSNW